MSVKIRLMQAGSKNRRTFRVVAVDESKKRDGLVIENLGSINPLVKPVQAIFNKDRIKAWQDKGAQITPGVTKFLKNA